MASATCGGLLLHRRYLNLPYTRNSINYHPKLRGSRPWCSPASTNLKNLRLMTRPKESGPLRITSSWKPISETESPPVDCVGAGLDVECVVVPEQKTKLVSGLNVKKPEEEAESNLFSQALEWAVLISPFFFWGTAMVPMKEVLPKAGPFFVAAFRLIPSGLLLVGYASYSKRKPPSGFMEWLSIALFGLVDAACFQGFLAEGLQRTSAGLGSVVIDSQPLTVAILASLLFGETIDGVGAAGLVLGVICLLLLETPVLTFNGSSTLWGSGEWWMLIAAQSMAIGSVMVRWVSKYSDPVMATGWHMIIGGLPLGYFYTKS